MKRKPVLLICDDDRDFHLAIKQSLKGICEFLSTYNSDEVLAVLRKQHFDCLLLDIQMRTELEGLESIPKILAISPQLPIIVMSGYTDFAYVRQAFKAGAHDYLAKDLENSDLPHLLQRTMERSSLKQQNEQKDFEILRDQNRHPLIGNSKSILDLKKMIAKIKNSPAPVIIHGETGTGKEVVARQLRGTLPDGTLAPFVAVDSSTIQSSLAESILFGHEQGAFTNADKTKKGLFEEADGGVIYFDEIANMPLDIQAKLLRVVQEKEITRLGSARSIPLEFRVICATNQDLEILVREGRFKADLYQRLNVLPVSLVPLHQRKEDIPALVSHFLELHAPSVQLAPEAVAALQQYIWPGNIRELLNVILYVTTMTTEGTIELSDLPPKFRDNFISIKCDSATNSEKTFYDRVSAFEKDILVTAMNGPSTNITKLALELGMDRSHLYSKLKQYGLSPARKS